MTTKTKTKTPTLENQFKEREEAALKEHRETVEALETTRDRAVALREAADLTEIAADDVESQLKRGNESVTAADLLTARAEHDRAKLLADGRQARWRALTKKAEATYSKDVAEVVLDALLSSSPFSGVAGIVGLATFQTNGFEPESVDVSGAAGPVLVVVQHDGGITEGGLGEAKLTIVWHRPPLTVPLTDEVVTAAFKQHGFTSRGFRAWSEETYDRLGPSVVHNVALHAPVIPTPLENVQDRFSQWSRNWATNLEGQHRAACASRGPRPVVEVREEGTKRITTVHVEAELWKDDRSFGGDSFDPSIIQRDARKGYLREVIDGVGRCVSAESVAPRGLRSAGATAFPTAALLTYEAEMG